MENKKMYEPSPEEIEFDFWAEKPESREHHCYFYLSEEELQQVFTVLDANPEACFADIPAELYKAAEEAVEERCIEYGYADIKIQKNMPDDILDRYEEYKKEKVEKNDNQDPKALAEQLQKEGKTVLSLIIKQQYFNEILRGEKKQEFREIKPSTEKKYILFDEDGYPQEDEDGNCVPIHYDYLLLYVGYNADRDSMLIECTGAHCECILDEEGEPLFYFINDKTKKEAFPTTYDPQTGEGYDENDQKMEDVVQYFVEQITYDLGKIVAKKVK